MTNSRTTKKALLSSVLALTLCVAMLIATTFAWFTDTASTSVNKIQAGKLDVQLLYKAANGAWENAEGKTLGWMQKTTADGTATMVTNDGEPLWEPGCTFTLPELKIVNNGNLKLKYNIGITGINGDAPLNEAIEWTMKLDNVDAKEKLGEDHILAAKPANGESASIFTISGHMEENAGNEYQDLSIDGISITVYATQAEGEYDSNGSNYDNGAAYNYKSATIMGDNGATTTLEIGKTYAIGQATVKVDESGNIEYTNTTGDGQDVTITTEGQDLTVNAPNDTIYHYGEGNIIRIDNIASHSFHEFGKVDILEIAKGRVVVENGNNVAVLQVKPTETGVTPVVAVPQSVVLETKLQVASEKSVEVAVIDSNGTKIENESFTIEQTGSPVNVAIPTELVEVLKKGDGDTVTLEEPKDYVAMIGTEPYGTFAEAVNAVKDGEAIKLTDSTAVKPNDYNVNNRLTVDENKVTINLNGKTLTVPNYTLILKGDNITLTNGEMTATTTDKSQAYGSYAVVAGGKGITISKVKMRGGVSVTGNNSSNAEPDATVTIKNCEITATNYYTVCAQSNAVATIENSKLIGGAGTFFWVEQKGYSEGNDPLASVSSKIIYDAKTVEFEGGNALYNTVGVAVVVKNLTVKDAEGKARTIDAVAVSTEAHLKTLVAAGENVMLASDITLSENTTLAIGKSVTIVGNGHKLIANYDGTTDEGKSGRVINIESPEPAGTLENVTLTLSGVDIVGPEDNSWNRGVSAWGVKKLTIIMDNCSASANHYALNIAGGNSNVKVVVRNTTLTGYNAFQTWSAGTNATFENCTLIGMNQWVNPSGSDENDSGTIVTNAATGSELTFKGCRIEANAIGDATEYFLVVQDDGGTTAGTSNVSVTFEGCEFFVNGTKVTGDAIKNNMSMQSDAKVTIN